MSVFIVLCHVHFSQCLCNLTRMAREPTLSACAGFGLLNKNDNTLVKHFVIVERQSINFVSDVMT